MIIVIYADNVFQKKNLSELEQKLFQVGKTYEFEIKKDLEQYQSIAELLTNIISDFCIHLLEHNNYSHYSVCQSGLFLTLQRTREPNHSPK